MRTNRVTNANDCDRLRATPLLSLVAIVAMTNFPALLVAKTIVGIGIAKSNDRVYTTTACIHGSMTVQ